MKRILLTIAIFLFLCGQSWPCDGDACKPIQLARMNAYVVGAGTVTAAPAIAFDATSSGNADYQTTPLTFAHTCTGSNLILIVATYNSTNSDNVTGITYNGDAMTELWSIDVTGGASFVAYYLLNPDAGTHNVVVSHTSTPNRLSGVAASYSGVTSIGTPGTTTGYDKVPTITTSSAVGEMVISVAQASGVDITEGTGITKRGTIYSGDEMRTVIGEKAGAASVVSAWSIIDDRWWGAGAVALKP